MPFTRFEDQTTISRETTTELFQFILGVPDLTGTVAEHRINEVTSKSHE